MCQQFLKVVRVIIWSIHVLTDMESNPAWKHLCIFPTGNQIYTTKSPYLVNWITKNQKKKVSNILRIWDKQTLYVSVSKFNSIRTRSSHFKSHNHFSRKRQLKKIKIKSPCHKISIEFLRCPNVLSTVFPDEVSSLPSTW